MKAKYNPVWNKGCRLWHHTSVKEGVWDAGKLVCEYVAILNPMRDDNTQPGYSEAWEAGIVVMS